MTYAKITPTDVLAAAKRDRLSKFVLLKNEDSCITVKFTDVYGYEQYLPLAIKIPKTDFRNSWIFDELRISRKPSSNRK